MLKKRLYSLIVELSPTTSAVLPAMMGNKTHALFLSLIAQVNPELATRLHDESPYRPFTVSSLEGATRQGQMISLEAGQVCYFRVTLLDDGELWRCISSYFLEARTRTVRLEQTAFTVLRLLSTSEADFTGWASNNDWQTLAMALPQSRMTLHFASPTAFSLGSHQFALYPEPLLVWDSLLRSWNLYAPEVIQMEKTVVREFVKNHIIISDYTLQTRTFHFPKHVQKGFVGSCTYLIKSAQPPANHIAALAMLTPYSGIGYKTTMGMGQARVEWN
jgi:CRISPR-associated endoribonuclease Cas6